MPRALGAALLGALLLVAFSPTAQAAVTAKLTTTPAAPDGFDGWYAGAPTIKLTASGAAGTASLVYCTDETDTCVPTVPYVAPFTAGDGEYYFRYQALDSGGPASAVASRLLRVDDTAPRVRSVTAPAWGDVSSETRIEFHFSERMDKDSVEDAVTASAAWELRWADRGTTLVFVAEGLAEGTHRVRVGTSARDQHGVPLAAARDYYHRALATPPTAEPGAEEPAPPTAQPGELSRVALEPAAPDGEDGWYLSPPRIRFEPLAGATVWWHAEGDPAQAYTAPILAPAGATTLWWYGRAGELAEPEQSLALQVDTAPPSVAPPTVSPAAPTAADRLTVRVDARDAEAGVRDAWVVVDGARHDLLPGRAYALPALAAGTHALQSFAIDRAGRTASSEPIELVVAAAPPVAPTPSTPPGPGAPSSPTPRGPDAPSRPMGLVIETAGAALGAVRGPAQVRIEGAAETSRVIVTLVDERGARTVLSDSAQGAAWDTRELENGYYRIEAQEVSASGQVVARASATVLVQNPQGDLVALAFVVAACALLAWLASRMRAPDVPLGSLASFALATSALALAFAYARAEPLAAGIALVVALALAGIEIALAWSQGIEVRYRASVPGIVSLAFTAVALRMPFGIAGDVQDDGSVTRFDRRRADALRASGILGGAFLLALPFLILGRLGGYALGDAGVEMALAFAALWALPIAPFPGALLWRWKPAAWAALAPLAFLPYCLHQLGILPPVALVALGTLGGILCARAAALLGHPAWGRHEAAAGRRGPGPLRALADDGLP